MAERLHGVTVRQKDSRFQAFHFFYLYTRGGNEEEQKPTYEKSHMRERRGGDGGERQEVEKTRRLSKVWDESHSRAVISEVSCTSSSEAATNLFYLPEEAPRNLLTLFLILFLSRLGTWMLELGSTDFPNVKIYVGVHTTRSYLSTFTLSPE